MLWSTESSKPIGVEHFDGIARSFWTCCKDREVNDVGIDQSGSNAAFMASQLSEVQLTGASVVTTNVAQYFNIHIVFELVHGHLTRH